MPPKRDGDLDNGHDNNLTKNDIRVLFFDLLERAADDGAFMDALINRLYNRLDFWERLAAKQADRMKRLLKEHGDNCEALKEHTKYHEDNEHKWGILKYCQLNFFKAIRWVIYISIVIIVLVVAPNELGKLIQAFIVKFFK